MLGRRQMTFNETFESSLIEKNNEKFTIDKSLIKGIKQNDVSKIIDKNEEIGVEDKKELFDEYGENEAVLVDARKRYDEVKKIAVKCQQQIQRLKGQRQILKQKHSQIQGSYEEKTQELQRIKDRHAEVTNSMESALFRKDTYAQMKNNLKSDILILKKRYFDKDVILMRDRTKLKSLRTEASSKTQLSLRCREMLSSMEKAFNGKQIERNDKINSIHEVINKKHFNVIRKEDREREIEEAMISAMTDKLPEEKQWSKIFLTNQFLKGLLKNRMEKLMLEHSKTEISFHRMKQQTSIKDANQFVDRFLNKERIYGQLLDSISDKEHQLEIVKQEKEDLEKEYQESLYHLEEYDDSKFKEKGIPEHQFLVIQNLNEQLLKIQRQKQLIYQWGTKFLCAFSKRPKDEITKKFKKGETKQLFIEVTNTIKKFLEQLKGEQNAQEKVEAAFLNTKVEERTLTEDTAQKNLRIKTISTYQDGSYDMFEDKDVAYDDLSEIDYLQHNRRAVKKNDLQNRRFRIKTKPY